MAKNIEHIYDRSGSECIPVVKSLVLATFFMSSATF